MEAQSFSYTASVNYSHSQNPTSSDITDDWEKKLDISIEVLKDEYAICIERLRNIEEKANKYFVVISIFFAGYFTVISSSISDKIEFTTDVITYKNILPYIFLFTLLVSVFFAYKAISNLLDCLKLIEISRIGNIGDMIRNNPSANSNTIKGTIVDSYQNCINNISKSTEEKQRFLKDVPQNVNKTILYLTISLMFLLIIKFVG